MEKNEVELSLVETLKNSELTSLATQYGELGLDKLLADGLLKDIPVFGTAHKMFKIGVSIHGYLFTKKLVQFLVNLSDVPREQRQKQINKLAEDPKEAHRVGETIMLLLDKANDMAKPAMMAKAFRAFLLDEIDFIALRRLWHAIDVVDVTCITDLTHIYQGTGYIEQDGTDVLPPSPEFHHLAICGLLMFDFGGMGGPPPNSPKTRNPDGSETSVLAIFEKGGFKKNLLGRLFVEKLCK